MPSITDVGGMKVGHSSDFKALTGCTVLIFEEGVTAGIEVRGTAPGTRQTDSLGPLHTVPEVHALLLTGGSSYGLDATGGVMRYLEEEGRGFDTGAARIPIVPTAVIFDLGVGDPKVRPDALMGYRACLNASVEVEEGSVGAGTGATVGKLFELERAMKGGLGTWSVKGPEGVVVGALVVVNAFGDVIDWRTGRQIAGLRDEKGKGLISTSEMLKQGVKKQRFGLFSQNTTLGVVATNAQLDKIGVIKLAQMVSGALAQVISPYGTTFDGDIVFALATGKVPMDVNNLAALAEEAVAEAVKRAVVLADGFGVIPAYRDLFS